MAQLVFVYDGKRVQDPPRSVPELLVWAKARPGRLTHPSVRNFLGSTFLKQALYELAADPAVLQKPATDANFGAVTAPLWACTVRTGRCSALRGLWFLSTIQARPNCRSTTSPSSR